MDIALGLLAVFVAGFVGGFLPSYLIDVWKHGWRNDR